MTWLVLHLLLQGGSTIKTSDSADPDQEPDNTTENVPQPLAKRNFDYGKRKPYILTYRSSGQNLAKILSI